MDGYHVEWANRNRPVTPETTSADVSEASRVEERSDEVSITERLSQDTTVTVPGSSLDEVPVTFSQRVKTRTAASLKRRIEERPVVSVFAQTALRQFENNDEGGITGIKWLDIAIGVLILALVIVYVIYSTPNFKAEVNAAWASITANIWISLIYFVLFLLVLFLIWAALDALFNFMLPSGNVKSIFP